MRVVVVVVVAVVVVVVGCRVIGGSVHLLGCVVLLATHT